MLIRVICLFPLSFQSFSICPHPQLLSIFGYTHPWFPPLQASSMSTFAPGPSFSSLSTHAVQCPQPVFSNSTVVPFVGPFSLLLHADGWPLRDMGLLLRLRSRPLPSDCPWPHSLVGLEDLITGVEGVRHRAAHLKWAGSEARVRRVVLLLLSGNSWIPRFILRCLCGDSSQCEASAGTWGSM